MTRRHLSLTNPVDTAGTWKPENLNQRRKKILLLADREASLKLNDNEHDNEHNEHRKRQTGQMAEAEQTSHPSWTRWESDFQKTMTTTKQQ